MRARASYGSGHGHVWRRAGVEVRQDRADATHLLLRCDCGASAYRLPSDRVRARGIVETPRARRGRQPRWSPRVVEVAP